MFSISYYFRLNLCIRLFLCVLILASVCYGNVCTVKTQVEEKL